MRLLALLLVASLVVPVAAQNASSSQTSGPLPTLRTGVRLVVVDVVVTDKNKQPVHGLKATDFQLYENNVSQTFRSFEERVATTDAAASRIEPLPKMPAGVYTNYAPGPTNGPLNILLLDRLNTALADQMQMQKQIVDFLNTMKPGQRIAVFGLTDHLQYLQSFTTDPELLKAVIAGKGKAKISDLLQEAVSPDNRTPTVSESADLLGQLVPDVADTNTALVQQVQDMITQLDQFQRVNTSFQDQMRAKYTLDAMNLLARYLSAFPGRKNLIWFSGSFPVNILPDLKSAEDISTGAGVQDIGLNNPFAAVESTEKEFRQTSALLSRSQVAVYPVAVKGLTDASMFYAESASMTASDLRYGNGAQNNLNDFGDSNFSNNSTMFMLADDTGGKAMINTNDLTGAVKDALENGANYYTIAYSPTNPNMDGEFRRILVKLREQGYTVSYRRGYFAEDTDRREPLQDSKAPPTNGMQLALTHGGPNPMQLIFSAKVQPVSAVTEMTLAADNKAGRKGVKGPYRRYRISYAIDPRELRSTMGPDGVRHNSLEFVVYVYDPVGNLVNSVANAVTSSMTPQAYMQALKIGVPFHQEVSVPDGGEYYLRIAMHDVKPDLVGAVEVPVDSVRRLAPIEAGNGQAPPLKAKR